MVFPRTFSHTFVIVMLSLWNPYCFTHLGGLTEMSVTYIFEVIPREITHEASKM